MDQSHFTRRIRIFWIQIQHNIAVKLKKCQIGKFITNSSDNRIPELEIYVVKTEQKSKEILLLVGSESLLIYESKK